MVEDQLNCRGKFSVALKNLRAQHDGGTYCVWEKMAAAHMDTIKGGTSVFASGAGGIPKKSTQKSIRSLADRVIPRF